METLNVEREAGVVTVTLQRPAKKNAISHAMWTELPEVFAEVAANRDDRVLVITGSGDAFCSGQDLTDPENATRFQGLGGALASMRRIGDVALQLHNLPKPTIAAVNGVAAGAGCNLALGCDLVVASSTARFSQIFVQRGLTVDFGGTWLLPRLIGLHKAKEFAFFGEILGAAQAQDLGVVNRVVEPEALMHVVDDMAVRLAKLAPLALSMMKRAFNASFSVTMAEALEQEAVAQASMFNSEDAAEAMSAFLEKRTPEFRGA